MEILIPLLIIIILIIVNGLFVAAEFAIVGTPRASIANAAASGEKAAVRVNLIVTNPRRQDRYIATAQLGITLSSLGLGMYGEHVLADGLASWFTAFGADRWIAAHSVASVVSIGILTYFHIVVGEMIPKSLALKQPMNTAIRVTPYIKAVQFLLYPLVNLLNGVGNGILRLFGVRRQSASSDHYRTPEELGYIVNESQVGGFLPEEAANIFKELLEFGDLTAGEVMVPRTLMTGIPRTANDRVIHRILRDKPHSRYPVYIETQDQIVGMVHVKDLLRCLPNCALRLGEILRPVPFVPATAKLEQVLKTMTLSRSQMAIVMDEQGGTAGLVTVEDLFEEVVGEIREDATEIPEIFRTPEGRLEVAGTARLEDVGQELELELEHEDVDTVSGLILMTLGRPASVGDVIIHKGFRWIVSSVKGRGVGQCFVEPVDRG